MLTCHLGTANIFAGFWIRACWICAKYAKINVPQIFPLLQYMNSVSKWISSVLKETAETDQGLYTKSVDYSFAQYLEIRLFFSNALNEWSEELRLISLGREFQISGPWCLIDFWARIILGFSKW